jgi:hypothetical protein
VPWKTPGASGIGSDRGSTVLGSITAPKIGLVTIPLNVDGIAVVQKWVSTPAANHGLVFQDFTDAFTDDLDFSSREESTIQKRPKLTIKYQSASSTASSLILRPLQNSENPRDVNVDAFVTPLDALAVVNALNTGFPEGEDVERPAMFLDVSGDGIVSPKDALLIINHLNETYVETGEGEGAPLDQALAVWGDDQLELLLLGHTQNHSRTEFDALESGAVRVKWPSDHGPRFVLQEQPASIAEKHSPEFASPPATVFEDLIADANRLSFDDGFNDFFALLGRN